MSQDDKTIFIPSVSGPRTQTPSASDLVYDMNAIADLGDEYHNNLIITRSQKIITLIRTVKKTLVMKDVKQFHSKLVEEIKLLDQHFLALDIPSETKLSARYMLCTAIDEAIVNTPWGIESNWSQHSMLRTFHNEGSGGEKFFSILQKLIQTPAKYIGLIELAYLLISLGFEGKYKSAHQGKSHLQKIELDLNQILETHGQKIPEDDVPVTAPAPDEKRLLNLIPVWVIVVALLGLLTLCYTGFRYSLSEQANQVESHINGISDGLTETGIRTKK